MGTNRIPPSSSSRRAEARSGGVDARQGAEKTEKSSKAGAAGALEKTGGTRGPPRRAGDRFSGTRTGPADRPGGRQAVTPPGPVTLTAVDRQRLDVDQASGLVGIGGGKFLVVDDDKGIYVTDLTSSDRVKSAKKHDELKDLEGICRGPDGDSVLVVSEKTGRVSSLSVERDGDEVSLGEPEAVGQLPRVSDEDNKGWEGIDVVPGRFFDDGHPRLCAVNEGSPKRVGFFSLPDLAESVILKLPKDVDKKLKDLSDIAVDPRTGHLFVLSDQSARIAELAITRQKTAAPGALLESVSLTTVGLHEVPTKKGEKPEGLDFSPDGQTLWVAMDGRSAVLELDVSRDDG